MGVVGDVRGMYSLADQLVAGASRLREARSRVKKHWSTIDMDGPSAKTLTASVTAHLRGLETAANQLDALAGQLRGAAFRVEQEKAAEERLRRELERQQLEAARKAAERKP